MGLAALRPLAQRVGHSLPRLGDRGFRLVLGGRKTGDTRSVVAAVLAAMVLGSIAVQGLPIAFAAALAMGCHCRRRGDPRSLGWWQGARDLLRGGCLLPRDLRPVAGLDADAVHRSRHRAARRRCGFGARPVGHPQRPG